MPDISDKLIVALDVDTLEKAKHFVDILYPTVKFFKVGSQLFTAYGPEAVKMIMKKGAHVFLDLKFHDIPNTVSHGVASGTGLNTELIFIGQTSGEAAQIKESTSLGVFMMTVHTMGGLDMLRAAAKAAAEKARDLKIAKPFVVGVTRLTSDEEKEDTKDEVLKAARLAKDAGLDGVVCSAHEASEVRKEFGKDFIIVTPSIRPKGYRRDDQKRSASAEEALKAGADFLVVGRPVLEAQDPLKAVKELA